MRNPRKRQKSPDPVADALYDDLAMDKKTSELVLLYDEASVLLFSKPKKKSIDFKTFKQE